jgi:hypothetical protein
MIHTRYLEEVNTEYNQKVRFQDEGHKYWAYSPYYEEWLASDTGSLISTTTILKEYWPDNFSFIARKKWNDKEARIRMRTDPTYEFFGCGTFEEVRERFGLEARTLGTKMHALYEDMANLLEYDRVHAGAQTLIMYEDALREGLYEKKYFFDFVFAFNLAGEGATRRFYRTEFMMWHPDLQITGTIDALIYDEVQKGFIIVDWKRCAGGVKGDPKNPKLRVDQLSPGGRGQKLVEFERLRMNKENQYGCQLTLYKHMFERITGQRVIGLYIVAIDSGKLGQEDAMRIIEIPLTKFDPAIKAVFRERAHTLLQDEEKLSEEHFDALMTYI